jgi:hypothetical protein
MNAMGTVRGKWRIVNWPFVIFWGSYVVGAALLAMWWFGE